MVPAGTAARVSASGRGVHGDVQPGEPDGFAHGREPARAAEPAGQRQRGDGPDPVQPGGEHSGTGQVPGRIQQLRTHGIEMCFQRGQDLQGRGDLQLPGRRQLDFRDAQQGGHSLPAAQPFAKLPGALMK